MKKFKIGDRVVINWDTVIKNLELFPGRPQLGGYVRKWMEEETSNNNINIHTIMDDENPNIGEKTFCYSLDKDGKIWFADFELALSSEKGSQDA